jgi:hypothetical protein
LQGDVHFIELGRAGYKIVLPLQDFLPEVAIQHRNSMLQVIDLFLNRAVSFREGGARKLRSVELVCEEGRKPRIAAQNVNRAIAPRLGVQALLLLATFAHEP